VGGDAFEEREGTLLGIEVIANRDGHEEMGNRVEKEMEGKYVG